MKNMFLKAFSGALVCLIGACAQVSSSSQTTIDGEKVFANILSTADYRTVTLKFGDQISCKGSYTGSALVSLKTAPLVCDDGKDGVAEIEAVKSGAVARIKYNIPSFRSGTVDIPLEDEPSTQGQSVIVKKSGPSGFRAVPNSSATISAVRREVTRRLKDPQSAIFGEFRSVTFVEDGEQRIAVCGGVNAKNSFGGYTGEQIFLAEQQQNGFIVVGPSANGALYCAQYGFKISVGGRFLN